MSLAYPIRLRWSWERVRYLIIIIKSELRIISHCWRLVEKKMARAVYHLIDMESRIHSFRFHSYSVVYACQWWDAYPESIQIFCMVLTLVCVSDPSYRTLSLICFKELIVSFFISVLMKWMCEHGLAALMILHDNCIISLCEFEDMDRGQCELVFLLILLLLACRNGKKQYCYSRIIYPIH